MYLLSYLSLRFNHSEETEFGSTARLYKCERPGYLETTPAIYYGLIYI